MNAIEMLVEMVETISYSRAEGVLAQLVVERMRQLGMQSRVDEAGNAVGYIGAHPEEAQRTIVLLGHIDTVPGRIPVRIEDGKLYGRGSVDAKGPFATFVQAVARLEAAADTSIVVVGAVEEEVASSKGAHFAATQYRPDACVIGEPSGWDAVTIGYKGCQWLDVHGARDCGHGAGPSRAVAEEVVSFWNRIAAEAPSFGPGGDGIFERVDVRLDAFRTNSDGLRDTARATVGMRLPEGFRSADFAARARSLASELGLDVEFRGELPAHTGARGDGLGRAFGRALASRGVRPRFLKKTGTSDMNVVGPAWRCPIVAYGPGDSSLDHTPHEHIVLADYERAIDVLADALVAGAWARPRVPQASLSASS
ncbi:MAG: [LysW]-lysine hydrolase [Planctomycetes bacterium]|nr:[LysW]-lysine hydrolase [Planctomycetota bacterium]MCB9904438.1 [LysW]-lysine hydrolase [Planctomycetota bacterium]